MDNVKKDSSIWRNSNKRAEDVVIAEIQQRVEEWFPKSNPATCDTDPLSKEGGEGPTLPAADEEKKEEEIRQPAPPNKEKIPGIGAKLKVWLGGFGTAGFGVGAWALASAAAGAAGGPAGIAAAILTIGGITALSGGVVFGAGKILNRAKGERAPRGEEKASQQAHSKAGWTTVQVMLWGLLSVGGGAAVLALAPAIAPIFIFAGLMTSAIGLIIGLDKSVSGIRMLKRRSDMAIADLRSNLSYGFNKIRGVLTPRETADALMQEVVGIQPRSWSLEMEATIKELLKVTDDDITRYEVATFKQTCENSAENAGKDVESFIRGLSWLLDELEKAAKGVREKLVDKIEGLTPEQRTIIDDAVKKFLADVNAKIQPAISTLDKLADKSGASVRAVRQCMKDMKNGQDLQGLVGSLGIFEADMARAVKDAVYTMLTVVGEIRHERVLKNLHLEVQGKINNTAKELRTQAYNALKEWSNEFQGKLQAFLEPKETTAFEGAKRFLRFKRGQSIASEAAKSVSVLSQSFINATKNMATQCKLEVPPVDALVLDSKLRLPNLGVISHDACEEIDQANAKVEVELQEILEVLKGELIKAGHSLHKTAHDMLTETVGALRHCKDVIPETKLPARWRGAGIEVLIKARVGLENFIRDVDTTKSRFEEGVKAVKTSADLTHFQEELGALYECYNRIVREVSDITVQTSQGVEAGLLANIPKEENLARRAYVNECRDVLRLMNLSMVRLLARLGSAVEVFRRGTTSAARSAEEKAYTARRGVFSVLEKHDVGIDVKQRGGAGYEQMVDDEIGATVLLEAFQDAVETLVKGAGREGEEEAIPLLKYSLALGINTQAGVLDSLLGGAKDRLRDVKNGALRTAEWVKELMVGDPVKTSKISDLTQQFEKAINDKVTKVGATIDWWNDKLGDVGQSIEARARESQHTVEDLLQSLKAYHVFNERASGAIGEAATLIKCTTVGIGAEIKMYVAEVRKIVEGTLAHERVEKALKACESEYVQNAQGIIEWEADRKQHAYDMLKGVTDALTENPGYAKPQPHALGGEKMSTTQLKKLGQDLRYGAEQGIRELVQEVTKQYGPETAGKGLLKICDALNVGSTVRSAVDDAIKNVPRGTTMPNNQTARGVLINRDAVQKFYEDKAALNNEIREALKAPIAAVQDGKFDKLRDKLSFMSFECVPIAHLLVSPLRPGSPMPDVQYTSRLMTNIGEMAPQDAGQKIGDRLEQVQHLKNKLDLTLGRTAAGMTFDKPELEQSVIEGVLRHLDSVVETGIKADASARQLERSGRVSVMWDAITDSIGKMIGLGESPELDKSASIAAKGLHEAVQGQVDAPEAATDTQRQADVRRNGGVRGR
ncbi:MAG: hypothetical protein ACTJLK_02360 [Anaplasma sp.]